MDQLSPMPLVSVLMTSYNREIYIKEAIESVLRQSYDSFELIIVDDNSTDNTVAVAKKYAQIDNRIRLYVNDVNLGDYPNRNRAASFARGEYLVFVDSDDMIYQDALEYIVRSFQQFPEANFGTIITDDHGKNTRPFTINSTEALNRHFFVDGFLFRGPGGTVIRRNYFNLIGGFPELYGPANDMYYNVKAACRSSVILLPYHYLYYRIHDGQEIKNQFSYLYNTYLYYRDLMDLIELPLSKDKKKYLLNKSKKRFIVNLFLYFKKTQKISHILKALKITRFGISDFVTGIVS